MASRILDYTQRKNDQSPQYDYLWRVEMPIISSHPIDPTSGNVMSGGGLYGKVNTGGVSQKRDESASDADEINHRVHSIEVPFYSFDTQKVNGAPGYIYTAHHRDLGAITVTLDEYEDGRTLKYINDWTHLVENPDGTFNPPALYKKTIKYYRMSSTNIDLHVSYYEGFFLTNVAALSSSQESDGIMQYSLTLTGDRVKHKIIPESELMPKIEAAEREITFEQSNHSKFVFGDMDGMTKSRIFNRIIDFL